MENHPYPPFIPKNAEKLILGSIPPWRFTVDDNNPANAQKRLQTGDVDFFYGSKNNRFWRVLEKVFHAGKLDCTEKMRVFLRKNKIGMADIVKRCRRAPERSALDQNLKDIKYDPEIVEILRKNPAIKVILFTSRFVESGFYRLFKRVIGDIRKSEEGRERFFRMVPDGREIKTVVLYSPSNMAIRGIRQSERFKLQVSRNKNYTENDFRIDEYKKYFLS